MMVAPTVGPIGDLAVSQTKEECGVDGNDWLMAEMPGLDLAVAAYQEAEEAYSSRLGGVGILFNPALAVEAGLKAALPHLIAWQLLSQSAMSSARDDPTEGLAELRQSVAAMDELARCAGIPPYSQVLVALANRADRAQGESGEFSG